MRETGEELFDDPASPAVVLARSPAQFGHLAGATDLGQCVLLHRVAFQLNLRDVRLGPEGVRVVLYHVAIYEGRTAVPVAGFRPQPSEIEDLAYFSTAEVDRMLADGALAPNMAFLWLAHGQRLLA